MQKIKNITVCFLIVGIVFPNQFAQAFDFIPNLLSHYFQHNEEHKDLSFLDFVYEHTANTGHHEEHHDKKNCPVHHTHSLTQQNLFVQKTNDFDLFIELSIELNNKKTKFPSYTSPTSDTNIDIWQPPKLV